MNNKTIFLTGATGLVGSYLLKILLQEGCRVYALASGKNNKSARERVLATLNFWDKYILAKKSDNLVVLEGDITERNFGLDKHMIALLTKEIEEFFHSAAVTQFNLLLKDVRKVNVEGTKNILDFAFKCKGKGNLNKVNHISTAYICGDYKGVFKEEDLDVGQNFNSTYEQSKFEAEKLIEEYRKKGLCVDIYRPPLVIGESTTGKTITFKQSVYQLLHIWNLEIFDSFPGREFLVNIVFVDDLCKAIFKISSSTPSIDKNNPPSPPFDKGGKGGFSDKNYHPFSSETIPLETILDVSSKYLGFSKPRLVSHNDFLKNNPTPAQKLLLKNNILAYNNNVRLDSTTTSKILSSYGFKFSNFSRGSFMKLLEYSKSSDFLKSKL